MFKTNNTLQWLKIYALQGHIPATLHFVQLENLVLKRARTRKTRLSHKMQPHSTRSPTPYRRQQYSDGL